MGVQDHDARYITRTLTDRDSMYIVDLTREYDLDSANHRDHDFESTRAPAPDAFDHECFAGHAA